MIQTINSRVYAGIFDRPVKVEDEGSFGVDPSPDAIGGCYGMGWYQYYRDRLTGEVYRVMCTDGVNGGKDAHKGADLSLIETYYRHIMRRTKDEVSDGATRVVISSREWHIMLGRIHWGWLDGSKDEGFDRSYRELDSGQIGTIEGVPVIIDPMADDDLDSVTQLYEPEPVVAYGAQRNVFGTIGDLMRSRS